MDKFTNFYSILFAKLLGRHYGRIREVIKIFAESLAVSHCSVRLNTLKACKRCILSKLQIIKTIITDNAAKLE